MPRADPYGGSTVLSPGSHCCTTPSASGDVAYNLLANCFLRIPAQNCLPKASFCLKLHYSVILGAAGSVPLFRPVPYPCR